MSEICLNICLITVTSFLLSYNKATNLVTTKSTHKHATMACYTFSERFWHADPQPTEKMDDPA